MRQLKLKYLLAGTVLALLPPTTSTAQQFPAAARGAYISPLLPGHHNVTLNGIATHYEVSGDGPLLVIPAPAIAQAELAKRFTLLIYDVPPSGDTTEHLDALRRYLKRDKIDLLGHGASAALATTYVTRYPERVRRLMTVSDETSTDRISKYFLSDE